VARLFGQKRKQKQLKVVGRKFAAARHAVITASTESSWAAGEPAVVAMAVVVASDCMPQRMQGKTV
jgi:hypothetical protein